MSRHDADRAVFATTCGLLALIVATAACDADTRGYAPDPTSNAEAALQDVAGPAVDDGVPILIRKADGMIVHGVFRGPSKLLDTVSEGTRIVDEHHTRAREVTYEAPEGVHAVGYAILVRRADGDLVHGVFNGPQKMMNTLSDGTRTFDEGEHSRVHVVTKRVG